MCPSYFGVNLENSGGIPREIPAHSAVTWFVYNLATASLVVEQRNEMALSKFQGAVLACNPLTEETLAARVKAHYSEFLAYLNPLELMPHLWKERLLTNSDRDELLGGSLRSQKACTILQSLKARGESAYSRFLRSLRAEKHHKGHAYLTSLLEGRLTATDELHECAQFKEIITNHIPDLMDLDVSSLAPKLWAHNLLTQDEFTDALNTRCSHGLKILQLIETIGTKGPLAYGIFVHCLGEEKSHSAHSEMFKVLSSELKCHQGTPQKLASTVDCSVLPFAVLSKSPHRLKLEGPLTGKRYNELMKFFQTCHHNGRWDLLEHKATELIAGEISDLKIVALLESAISWIFRRDEDKVITLVHDAMEGCKFISANNAKFLKGRGEYILSRHFRYLKDYEKAQTHVAKAKDHLFLAEPGEDTSFVSYCEACVRVERLPNSPSQQEVKEVETTFTFAIGDDLSHETGLKLVAAHSLIRLAQMHLGSTHYNPGVTNDPQRIDKAQKYLHAVDVSSLCDRSKCHYHIFESDLFRSGKDASRATVAANTALTLAQSHSFALEISSAEARLQELRVH